MKKKTVRRYHTTKRANSKATGKEYLLSESDIHLLLYQARITIDQVGKGLENYALARYNDSGPYALGNCRFITVRENNAEIAQGNRGKYVRSPQHPSRHRDRDSGGRFVSS